MTARDDDTHAGSRRSALKILIECGLFRGSSAPSTKDVAKIIDSFQISGSDKPFVPSPFRISETMCGSNLAISCMISLLEGLRGRELKAEVDVEQCSWLAFAQYSTTWEIEDGGMFAENTLLFNKRFAAQLAASNPTKKDSQPTKPATITPLGEDQLLDPPEGTPGISPLFYTIRSFLSDTFKTKDRFISLFPRINDHPKDYLDALKFPQEEIQHLIRLGLSSPATHPKTYLKHHDELITRLQNHIKQQPAFELDERVKKRGMISAVPFTRAEFEQTEQGKVLAKLPRVTLERAVSVQAPKTVDEWTALLQGKANDDQPASLWPQKGWNCGSFPKLLPSRGVLYGLKVLDVTRIIAGPMAGLQLAQLGADVMRVASADIIDYPVYDLGINLNKRTVEIDLRSDAGKAKMRELIWEADVVINNLLAGSLEKLGFGFKDVLEIVKQRPRGIVYVETNTFGFHGPMAKIPGVELLGQFYTGMSVEQGKFQPYTDGSQVPSVTPILACDCTTGLNAALGALVSLYKRAVSGGSYLVRTSLAQTALFIQDLGTYQDEAMVRRLWDGLPKHTVGMVADPSTVEANGLTEYFTRMSRFMKAKGVRGGQWESGFWMRTLENPVGGSVVSFLPILKLSLQDPNLSYLRFVSRQLRYDSHVGFIFDPEDPEGIDQDVRDLIPVGERTYKCKPERELRKDIERFLEKKRAAKSGGRGAEGISVKL